MNRKLALPLILIVIVLGVFALYAKLSHPQVISESNAPTYNPTPVQEEEFDLTLVGGRPAKDADFDWHGKQGRLLSFIVGSDQSGVIYFTKDQGETIQRAIQVTPSNQFYIPSDNPGSYKVVFAVGADLKDPNAGRQSSYYLGTFTIDGQ